MQRSSNKAVEARVGELVQLYSTHDANAAHLLCDRYASDALAYRIIDANLVARDVSYGELRSASEQFAGALQALGVRPGDRVATLMGKSWTYLVTLMGIWRLGAVHVPLFTAFAPPAIALRLQGSGAKIVVCDPSQRKKLEPSADIPAGAPWRVITTGEAPGDELGFQSLMRAASPLMQAATIGGEGALIHIYTSGTTGSPKGVVVPLRALASFRAYAEFALDLRPDDLYWCGADPGWAYGLYFGILSSLSTGTPSILLEGGFTPEATIAVLADQGVTNFAAAPTVYRALRASELKPSSPLRLRCASSAGEPLTPEVNDWARDALGISVHDHYGQTEAGMLINNHHNPSLGAALKVGSMGRVMPGWAAAVLHEDCDEEVGPNEIGRIVMDLKRSAFAWFKGYEGNADKSAEKFSSDGRWYITGDTGRVDEDGYFHFSSRDDDVIIMAGYRIGPFEVESVLVTHPAVLEAAVIAAPDEVRGEVLEAFVVLREGRAATDELAREIQTWVKTRYAAHAYPRAVHFADALPKTPSGKIQRYVLKQQRRQAISPA